MISSGVSERESLSIANLRIGSPSLPWPKIRLVRFPLKWQSELEAGAIKQLSTAGATAILKRHKLFTPAENLAAPKIHIPGNRYTFRGP